MQCPNPTTRKHKDKFITHNCGYCVACKVNKQSEWVTRWNKELQKAITGIFTTLTLSQENLEIVESIDKKTGEVSYHETISKDRHQKYLKRLRKLDAKNHKLYPQKANWPKIKYHSVGDYGEETHRSHYHDLIVNLHPKTIQQIQKAWSINGKPLGNVNTSPIKPSRIRYVVSHNWKSVNLPLKEEQQKPFTHMSRNIGIDYVESNKSMHKKSGQKFIKNANGMQTMPKLYKDKIFGKTNEHQKLKNQYEFDKMKIEFEKKNGKSYDQYQQEKRDSYERKMSRNKKNII